MDNAANEPETSTADEPVVKILTAHDILGADDRKIETVKVPEWGGCVNVRSMMGDERDAFDAAGLGQDGESDSNAYMQNYRARLVACTCCDESGKLLFSVHQVASLGKKNSTALNRVVRVAQRLNGLTREGIEEAKKADAKQGETQTA